MARSPFPNSSDYPYHVTNRCHNKVNFPLTTERTWQILSTQLHFTSHAFSLEILAFVLMANHYHLVIRSPNCNLSNAMAWFNRETARQLNQESNQINQIWGGRFFRSEIRSPHHFECVYKYVYRNPVTAQITTKVEDYPFSTLHGVLGYQPLIIPTHDERLLNSPNRTLDWLNHTPSRENMEYVRKGLRRQVFTLPKIDSRPNPLENDML